MSPPPPAADDYLSVASGTGLPLYMDFPYIRVLSPPDGSQWTLHISTVMYQGATVLADITRYLCGLGVSHKIPVSLEALQQILDGGMGMQHLCKAITIYPADATAANDIAHELIRYTQNLAGPFIATATRLGGNVFASLEAPAATHEKTVSTDVPWPFTGIAPEAYPAAQRWQHGKYFVVQNLKPDAKGAVSKALYLKHRVIPTWCMVKEGNRHMFTDIAGRDMSDRLKWQGLLHRQLSPEIPVPSILDSYSTPNADYLVMEWIKGISLEAFIQEAAPQRVHAVLHQVLAIIEKLHRKGFIHRDINPVNFLIKKNDSICLIDLELVFDTHNTRPDPPFTLGTIGFMSPQQAAQESPTFEDDIYSLGALLIFALTHQPVTRFNFQAPDIVSQLDWFLHDKTFACVLAKAVAGNPAHRPSLAGLRTAFSAFIAARSPASGAALRCPHSQSENVYASLHIIDRTAALAVNALNSPLYADGNGWWLSTMADPAGDIGNDNQLLLPQPGFFSGISGILYSLFRLQRPKGALPSFRDAYIKNFGFVLNMVENDPAYPGGLAGGSAGAAIALAEGIKADVFSDDGQITALVYECLKKPVTGLDLASGIAGVGLALLLTTPVLPAELTSPLSQEIIQSLVSAQRHDGSWLSDPGLFSGDAGILFFLLQQVRTHPNDAVIAAIRRGMLSLEKRRYPDAWLANGEAGRALVFVLAYRILQETAYRKKAETMMRGWRQPTLVADLTIAAGLAGWGEVFLEAAAAFKDQQWRHKARTIAMDLAHSFYRDTEEYGAWRAKISALPCPSLMHGNMGIVHFMERFRHPDRYAFILSPE